jgi:hypothetical protein
MPYYRRHELVALTLISIKFVVTTDSFDLIMLQKSACSFLKFTVIRKILSVLHFYLNMSCFPLFVLSITTFHVILLTNATYLFSVFLNRIYDRTHLNISMYKAMPGQCSQCLEIFAGC